MLLAQQALFERLHPHNLPVAQPQQSQQQQPPAHVEPPARGLPGRRLCVHARYACLCRSPLFARACTRMAPLVHIATTLSVPRA